MPRLPSALAICRARRCSSRYVVRWTSPSTRRETISPSRMMPIRVLDQRRDQQRHLHHQALQHSNVSRRALFCKSAASPTYAGDSVPRSSSSYNRSPLGEPFGNTRRCKKSLQRQTKRRSTSDCASTIRLRGYRAFFTRACRRRRCLSPTWSGFPKPRASSLASAQNKLRAPDFDRRHCRQSADWRAAIRWPPSTRAISSASTCRAWATAARCCWARRSARPVSTGSCS